MLASLLVQACRRLDPQLNSRIWCLYFCAGWWFTLVFVDESESLSNFEETWKKNNGIFDQDDQLNKMKKIPLTLTYQIITLT